MLKDPERQAILDCIRLGAPLVDAAMAAGICYSTLRKWRQYGRADRKAGKQSAFRAFLDDCDRYKAMFVSDTVKLISDAGDRNWRARAWLAERRSPEKFGDNMHEIRAMQKQLAEVSALLAKLTSDRQTEDSKPPTQDQS